MNRHLPDGFHLFEEKRKQETLEKFGLPIPPSPTIPRTRQRMLWLLQYIANTSYKGTVAWDEESVDLFVEAFPESRKTLKYYIMGANSCPMMNRAAATAHDLGFLKAGHVGNQDARQYNQRTWCRYWSLTPLGEAELAEANHGE